MELEFLKMQTAGRDVIVVDRARYPALEGVALAAFGRAILDRHTGVGGEALLLIRRGSNDGLDMHLLTAAGREEEPTLNDALCAGRYAIDSGMVSRTATPASGPGRTVTLEALDSRSIMADLGTPLRLDGQVLVEDPGASYTQTTDLDGRDFTFTPLRVGPAQAVAFVPDFEMDIRRLSVGFRRAAPEATLDPGDPVADPAEVTYARVSSRSRISARTWRFGHGEARSEGFAAAAVAVAGALHGFVDRDTIVSARGGELYVSWSERNNRLYVTGAAEYVFTGTYTVEER